LRKLSAHCLGECVLTWVAEVAKNSRHASDAPDAALASAAFRYIRITRFCRGGNLSQPSLARFGKFREVFFDAGDEATLAGLNSGTLRLDIGCTCYRLPMLLRHRDSCGKQHCSADYYEALHHHSSTPRQTLWQRNIGEFRASPQWAHVYFEEDPDRGELPFATRHLPKAKRRKGSLTAAAASICGVRF
jgi:hypothetical protein